jgi:endonuclease YncB( thermonuclease family)
MKRSIFFLLLVTMCAASAAAQLGTGGEVLDVVDGKTVIVGVPTGRFTLELQYIDVPEQGQPLHSVVTDHVRKMLLGKSVELRTKSFTHGKATGRLMLNGVDVSQQLLRDGAAWHVGIETSGQRRDEFDTYAESETLARNEKRGVWSVQGLEPAWQFRAKAKQEQVVIKQPVKSASSDTKPAVKRKGYWSDMNPWLKDPGAVAHGYNAATQTGFLGTLMGGIKDDAAAAAGKLMALDITYFYTEKGKNGRTGYFVVRVISLGDSFRFLKSNALTVEVDGKTFVVGKPHRVTGNGPAYENAEELKYRVDRSIIEKITNGGDVVIKIGDYMIRPRTMLQMRLYTMLQSAT